MFTAIDTVLRKVNRQIDRYKGKRRGRRRAAGTLVEPDAMGVEPAEAEEEIASIVRVKRFPITPMHPEEAIEQMELLGHDFFVLLQCRSWPDQRPISPQRRQLWLVAARVD